MNSKKQILFIGPLPPPLGGVAIINESFQKLNYNDYEIISFNTSRGNEKEDLYNVNILKKAWPQLIIIKKFFFFVKNNEFFIANLFVTSGLGFLREIFFILILKFFKKNFIIHFHSKKKGEFFLKKNKIQILAFFLNMADKIIVLSNDHYQYFIQFFKKEKMTIIENFVDYDLYDCDIINKKEEFLYIGRLSEKKGFFDLLECVSILKERKYLIKFNIVGLAENEMEERKINDFIMNKNIGDMFRFYGLKFGKEKYDLFKKCKYFVFPSHFENSPVVLKEAIASKMAIVVSDIEANRNVLDMVENHIYFEVKNPIDMATKIIMMLNDDERTLRLMLNSEKTKIFDSEIARIKLLQVIKKFENDGEKI